MTEMMDVLLPIFIGICVLLTCRFLITPFEYLQRKEVIEDENKRTRKKEVIE